MQVSSINTLDLVTEQSSAIQIDEWIEEKKKATSDFFGGLAKIKIILGTLLLAGITNNEYPKLKDKYINQNYLSIHRERENQTCFS